MKKRIIGIDVARAFAVIGMIVVNFKVVFGSSGTDWLVVLSGVFDGKAAATFVVLAGIGIALMTRSAIEAGKAAKLKNAQIKIVKRAVFLFVVGLSYIVIWPADILHFYGVYMLLTLFLLQKSPKTILFAALALIFSYPFLMLFWSYDTGWDFSTLNYLDFWSLEGFVRNLFYNGFHPVVPWAAFMLMGLWFGRQPLNDNQFIQKALWVSLSVFVAVQCLSYLTILLLAGGNADIAADLRQILGTNPMPPLPFYMISGISIAIAVISACIIVSKKFAENPVILALEKTGKLALTFYVAHVIIGMGMVEVLNPDKLGTYSIEFSLGYAVVFSLLCVVFAVIWTRYSTSGPLEWLMRKIIN